MNNPILSSFLMAAVMELGDKTQVLSFLLAVRFRRPWTVLAGVFVGALANHALASLAGEWIGLRLRPEWLALILGALFFCFAIWSIGSSTEAATTEQMPSRQGVLISTAIWIFLAEMGDKTQILVAALAARHASIVGVTGGSTLGMVTMSALGIFLGENFSEKVPVRWIKLISAMVFFACGVASLLGSVSP